MLRNHALNQKFKQYYKIRGGTDLLPKAFASQLSEKIHYATPVVKIEHPCAGRYRQISPGGLVIMR